MRHPFRAQPIPEQFLKVFLKVIKKKKPDTKPYRQTIKNIPPGHEQTHKTTTILKKNTKSAKVMENKT